jgi:hypothetical protein
LHIHVTDTTYKLLERKSYDAQERPKMNINGNLSITTYFILNKRDRVGKAQARPYQLILEEMKREDIEKAKLKQSSSLKSGAVQNLAGHTPLAPPPVKIIETSSIQPAPEPVLAPIAVVTQAMPVLVKQQTLDDDDDSYPNSRNSVAQARFSMNPSIQTFAINADTRESVPTLGRQSRSKTCQLL